MNKKIVTLAILLIFAGSAVWFLSTKDKNPSGTQDRIKIGAIIPLSGAVSTYGDALSKGFNLAAEEFDGKFEIVYQDSKADPKEGITAYQKLRNLDGIDYFLGDATSGVCLAIAPLAEQNKTPLLISIATSDELKDSGEFIFRNTPSNFRQAEKAAEYISETSANKTVALIYKLSAYGDNLAKVFKKEAPENELEVVLDLGYPEDTRDFTDIVARLAESGASAVFCPGNYEETAALVKKVREAGLSIPLIGTDGAYSPKLMELAGDAAEGFALTMMSVEESAAVYQSFKEAFLKKYQEDPNVFSAYGYEGAKIMMQAISEAEETAPDSVRKRLSRGKLEGLDGSISFDNDGEIERPFGILLIEDNEFKPADLK